MDKRKMDGVRKRRGLNMGPQGKETGGRDGVERSREGAKIRRVLEDEKKQDKISTKV